MLDERKSAILHAVVEEYIETAQPVGSAHVAQRSALAVSSATVRNEMGVLEREGYLTQPHTSAGRIPTDKGYRLFVDSLAPGALGPVQSQQVRAFFAKAHGELERTLADTSRLLSALTDYAAVVVGPSHEVARIRSVQIVGLGPRLALVVIVLSNGVVEKRPLELAREVSDLSLAAASTMLASLLTGTSWGGAAPDVLPSEDASVDELTNAALGALGGVAEGDGGQVFVGGASRMAVAFDAVETIRGVLGILEEQYVMVGLLSDVLGRGLSVSIGAEHGVPSLADCSVIVAPYEVEGEQLGTVGILGPTRMHYEQALAAVAVVSRRLGRALSEGS
ncbi:MAG: heat-inducible transcriptional repressor HrcA [Actinomycetota bacterium]|nr:heat-inducible transcriptional repressor HrcA [Actinomycetota bacterium]